MEGCQITTVPPGQQAGAQEYVDPLHMEEVEPDHEATTDLPSVHTSSMHGDDVHSDTEQDSEESPIPGTSGLPSNVCQAIPSPPYAASYPGLLSTMPSTSHTASSPLLESSCSQYPQHFIGRGTMDLSASDDQLSGTCMPASGTLSGFQGAGAYSPVPLHFGETSALSCSALKLPAYDSKSNLSETASALLAICRICHQPGDEYDILISPCRCAGTLQFIHNTCLMKWLEITSKKSRKPPKCELCHYQYHRHKKFKLDHWRFPKVSRQDKILHCIFIVNLLIMIGCAIATVMCFLSDKGQINRFPRNKATLTTEEIITLSCGVLFFVSFFIAMSVQIKARRTLYQLFVKFIMQNMEWEIDQYDKSKDSLYANKQDLLKSYV